MKKPESLSTKHLLAWVAVAIMTMSGCSVNPPDPKALPSVPAQWRMPHQSSGGVFDSAQGLAPLTQWWQQWHDDALINLIEQAQQASPSVAAAATRVAQARLEATRAGAVLLPQVDASAGLTRAPLAATGALQTQATASLQVAWELDLWGSQKQLHQANNAMVQASQAQWHDARTAVAAEVARQYVGWRSCLQLVAVVQMDAQSRQVVANLTQAKHRAGFESVDHLALTQANAAQGRMLVDQQQTQCQASLAALSALTAVDASALEKTTLERVASTQGLPVLPQLAQQSVPQVLPAQLLLQRPDVFAASRQVAKASAQVGAEQASQYPQLSLGGMVGRIQTLGVGGDGTAWSLGPLQVRLPVFDAGKRQSQVQLATAQYDQAVVSYQASVRQAVQEVEQALLQLGSTAARQMDANQATTHLQQAFVASQQRYQAGLGSLLELEDVRRTALGAQQTLTLLQRERLWAWIDLYRALGGGWQMPNPNDTPS